jgi:hypothetical protein
MGPTHEVGNVEPLKVESKKVQKFGQNMNSKS